MSSPIILPDNAPFTSEQRAWLSEFLTRALAGSATVAPSGPAVPATILWGSQTGNSEGCAKKLAKAMRNANFDPKVVDMADYAPERLASEKNLLLITSTYGDGEPPDNAEALYNYILSEDAARMEGVKFSVLALGDTEYPDFCKCGIDFDRRFAELGAERISELVLCDVDYEEAFDTWKKAVMEALGGGEQAITIGESEGGFEGYGKKNPFPAEILRTRNLNGAESERETYHIEIGLDGSGLEYEAGDALGVMPRNSPEHVDELLSHLPFNIRDEVPLPAGGEAPLRDALISYYDIRSVTRPFLEKWQAKSGSPYLRALIEGNDKETIDKFCWGREVIDLVIDHPADFPDAEEFVGTLKKLQPRLYSIASSPKAHPGEVHLTVAIVRYDSFGRKRGGVCSTYLSDRIAGEKPGVFVHKNKAFRLPEDPAVPVIMIGPGTGIAPFRAFLEERQITEATGKNWLFFGNPYKSTDFLYQDELEAMQSEGDLEKMSLARLDLAFSRDQAHKIYVQDRMREAGEELFKWLEEGAHLYVCGDASRMAKDVDKALHDVIAEHGKLSPEAAAEYVQELKKQKRYSRDVY